MIQGFIKDLTTAIKSIHQKIDFNASSLDGHCSVRWYKHRYSTINRTEIKVVGHKAIFGAVWQTIYARAENSSVQYHFKFTYNLLISTFSYCRQLHENHRYTCLQGSHFQNGFQERAYGKNSVRWHMISAYLLFYFGTCFCLHIYIYIYIYISINLFNVKQFRETFCSLFGNSPHHVIFLRWQTWKPKSLERKNLTKCWFRYTVF